MHGLFHERWQSKDEHFWVASGFGGSCLVVWVPAMDGDGLWGWSISFVRMLGESVGKSFV